MGNRRRIVYNQMGTLERLELYSDAVNTAIEGFSTTTLTLVSPGNNVTLSHCQFANATVEIISAENALIKDTNFLGETKFDKLKGYVEFVQNPFPSSTSTFTIANMKNLRLSATNLSQVPHRSRRQRHGVGQRRRRTCALRRHASQGGEDGRAV